MRQKHKNQCEVLIVGGGHSGLSLAACLGSIGIDVICLERGAPKARTAKNADGRTLALSYRTMEVLAQGGLADAIKKQACPILHIRVADQDSFSHLDFNAKEVGDDPFGWIIENPLFQGLLEKRIAQLKNVRVIADADVHDIECNADIARVTLQDGRVFDAQLIVGADGRKSLCREKAGIPTYGWDYHQTAVVCTICHSIPHHHVAVEHFMPGGPFATLPMTQNRSSIVWTERTDAGQALMQMGEADFTAMLQDKVRDYLGEIELQGKRFAYPLTLQHARAYRAQRMALVADAAHGIHPIAGQGLNLGMGDIEVLVEELFEASRLGLDLGSDSLLRRYEKRRRIDNGNMIVMTDLLDRLFSTAAPPVQFARRFGLDMVQNMKPLKKFFMRTAMGKSAMTA